MSAAGIVADHSAKRVAVVSRRIRTEGQLMLFGFLAQRVEIATRFDRCKLALRIEPKDAMHIFREVDDDGSIAGLTAKCGPTAARGDRHVELVAEPDGGCDILGAAWQDDAIG